MQEKEVWKDIIDYEGLYQVSNLGRVKSLIGKEKILKPSDNGHGYLALILCKDGIKKRYYIHRLVCEAFVPNDDPEHKTQASHLDESRDNNCASNLCWATTKENLNMPLHKERLSKGRGSKVICLDTNKIYHSTREAERQTGIFSSSIIRVCSGRAELAGGYQWAYLDSNDNPIIKSFTHKTTNLKKCLCVETKKIYDSYKAAAADLGLVPEAISNCIRGMSKTCGGYHWQYVS